MTIQDRILVYLAEHSEGVDDDTMSAALGLRSRQQVNQRCRRLEQFGIIMRRVVDGKIRNFLNQNAPPFPPRDRNTAIDTAERPWYWEGSVQSAVARYLASNNYQIEFEANTATRQPGKDIIAVAPSGDTLWVSVKGYPEGTPRTPARNQAKHWFGHALFDLILWHGEDPPKVLALALPEQKTYQNLAHRASWFLASLGACIYWVREGGSVYTERPSEARQH